MTEVLIAGATGGREHALGLALHQDGAALVDFTHSGNAGTGTESGLGINVRLTGNAGIARYAADIGYDLVIVGPEQPLVEGLADEIRGRGIPVVGPGAVGARLEASKAHTARFADRYGIRQPDYVITESPQEAEAYALNRDPKSYVAKADGLAGGKGALLHDDPELAIKDIRAMARGEKFGQTGRVIVFQRRLHPAGPEVSALYLLDGKHFTLLPLSQDHKRLADHDKGPKTGGMGAYAPVPFEDDALIDELLDIGSRISEGLIVEGIDYRGVIYAGLMKDVENENKLSLLEINVRFGDPETQVILARLQQSGINTLDLLYSVANGNLHTEHRGRYLGKHAAGTALTVCLAAGGYPDAKADRLPIYGLDRDYEDVTVHHGGTVFDDVKMQAMAVGGRVLYITGRGENADEAAARAYAAIGDGAVHFEAMRYRNDIAWQARTEPGLR